MREKYWEIALAGLLHDVGKLGQRAFEHKKGLSSISENLESQICVEKGKEGYSHFHTLYTNEFISSVYDELPENWSLGIALTSVRELAIYHHRPNTEEQKIISEADVLSSAMERIKDESSKGHFRKVCLHAIVNEILIDGKEGNGKKYRHNMQAYEYETSIVFPNEELAEENRIKNYHALWESLKAEWKRNQIPHPWKYINRSLSILEKYSWCIPSATNVRPDISLYDHIKTTSALALCLYAAENKDLPFILVTGDFSGIQNYIFDLHHGTGGTAKTLRGRSFKVGLFSDSVALYILRENNCPLTHNLMSAGGHFYLLLPNTSDTLKNLYDTQSQLENWLHKEYKGAFRFNLAWSGVSKEEIKDFSLAMDKIHRELEHQKSQPFKTVLIQNKWIPQNFLSAKMEIDDEKICKSCYKRPGLLENDTDKKKHICNICADDRETGRKILKNPLIPIFNDAGISSPFFRWEYGNKGLENAVFILQTQYDEEVSEKLPIQIQRKAIYIPKKGDNPLEFTEIAEKALGRPALAFLKADVDNLGYIFAKGFPDKEKSISRIATLSRMLDYFFSAYLKELVETEFPNIYIVFSGGDDLVMIGPWNDIFDFTLEMRGKFRQYTCYNQAWGLSAGIALANASTPVLTAVGWAEEQLTLSKSRTEGDDIVKDGFTAFGETMSWDEAEQVISQGKKVVEWLQNNTLSSGQVRRLFIYSQMYRDYKNSGYNDTRHLRFIPQLIYDIKRNWQDKTADEKEAILWASALQYPERKEIEQLYFICQYALNGARKTRKEKENE